MRPWTARPGEILKGITILPAGKRRDGLQEWLDGTLRPWFCLPDFAGDRSDCGAMGTIAGRYGAEPPGTILEQSRNTRKFAHPPAPICLRLALSSHQQETEMSDGNGF